MSKLNIEGVTEMLLSLCARRYSDKERLLIITAWEHALRGVPMEKIKSGLDKAIEAHDGFMMPPGKFKELCLTGAGCQSAEDEAREAWYLVVKNLNAYCSPVFRDSAIAEAVRKMGGWKRLCGMIVFPPEKSEEPFRRKDFIDLYLVAKRQNIEFSPMLKGSDNFFINGESRSDYKFIGYDAGFGKKAILAQIEQKETADKRILAMLTGKIKCQIER